MTKFTILSKSPPRADDDNEAKAGTRPVGAAAMLGMT